MDVVISGASGLIGTALRTALTDAGHRPIALVRRAARGADEIEWDIPAGRLDATSLEGIDGVVHLSGAGIGDKRWTDKYKDVLLTSRTESTLLLSSRLAALSRPPKAFLSGSAIGFYGDRGTEVLDESSSNGDGFLADLCARWEASTLPALDAGITTTFLRTGIVLTPSGGALAKMLPLFRFGLGGRFGSGEQIMSWISINDYVSATISLLETPTPGPVNMTAPNPVSNATFAKALGQALHRPSLLPVPAFGPRLILGRELADALLFDGADIRPKVLLDRGFAFAEPTIEECLSTIL